MGERPVQHALGDGRGADDAAVAAAECLQVRRGVDVGDGGDGLVGIAQHLVQFAPRAFHFGEVGQINHRTTGGGGGRGRGRRGARGGGGGRGRGGRAAGREGGRRR